MYIAPPHSPETSKQSDTSMDCSSGRRLPEQLWTALSQRLHLESDDKEFQRYFDHLVSGLKNDLEANCDLFPKQLKRDYRSLKFLMGQFRKLFVLRSTTDAPATEAVHQLFAAASEKVDFERLMKDLCTLEDICETLELKSKLAGSPKGKRYEKVFLRRLDKLLDRCPACPTARKRAGIAIDLIRWAGGHPASPASIARYMRHLRRKG